MRKQGLARSITNHASILLYRYVPVTKAAWGCKTDITHDLVLGINESSYQSILSDVRQISHMILY